MDTRAFGDGGELREAPVEFEVLRKGRNKFTINGKQSCFELTDDDALAIVREFNDRKKDVVIDWDHSTLNKQVASVGDAPAAGWTRLELSPGGVVAKVINWTKKAKERIANGEYRYFSPVIHFDNGKPRAIQSIGLTNHPAIHEQMPLVAANDMFDATAVIDENLNTVLTGYESMGRNIKNAIAELQTELGKVFTNMNELAMNNPMVEQRIHAFSDNLFADDLKAFADDFSIQIPPLTQLQDMVTRYLYKGLSVDGVTSDTSMTIGERINLLNEWNAGLNSYIANYRDLLNKTPDERKADVNMLIDWMTSQNATIVQAIDKLKASGEVAAAQTVTFADMDEESAKQSIMNYINKILESVPMSQGKVLESVATSILAMLNMKPTEKEVVQEAVVERTPQSLYSAMNDLGLQKCSNDDELLKAIKALSDSHKELESKWDAKNAKEKVDAEQVLALNDKIATLEAEKIVDKVIFKQHGKITEGQRDWAVKFAKRDIKGFMDWVAGAPVMFTDMRVTPKEEKLSRKKTFSPEAVKIAQAFGNSPEEVYQQ